MWSLKCDFLKSGGKTLEKHKKLTESGGETSIFGQNLVGVTGFEPAASTSQMSRATNCATPRYLFDCRIATYGRQLNSRAACHILKNEKAEKHK